MERLVSIKGIRNQQKRANSQHPTKGWDNRFHIHQIPNYNAFADPYCVGLKGVMQLKQNKRKALILPGGIRVNRRKERQKSPVSGIYQANQPSISKDHFKSKEGEIISNISGSPQDDSFTYADDKRIQQPNVSRQIFQQNCISGNAGRELSDCGNTPLQAMEMNLNKSEDNGCSRKNESVLDISSSNLNLLNPNNDSRKKEWANRLSTNKGTKSKVSMSSSRNNSRRAQIKISEEETKSFIDELNKVYESENIPQRHMDLFFDSINSLPTQNKALVIAKEIQKMKQNRSDVQKLLKAIETREQTLKQLKDLERKFSESPAELENSNLQKQAIDILTSLREDSIKVVKLVTKWRKGLLQNFNFSEAFLKLYKANDIPFLYDNQNYLIKMKGDCNFLFTSELSKLFQFKKSDPFLFVPTFSMSHSIYLDKKLGTKMMSYAKQKGKILAPMPSKYFKKYKECEIIIEEEIKNLNKGMKSLEVPNSEITPADKKTSSTALRVSYANNTKFPYRSINKDNKENLKYARKEESPSSRKKKYINSKARKSTNETFFGDNSMTPIKKISFDNVLTKHITNDSLNQDDVITHENQIHMYPLGIKESQAEQFLIQYFNTLQPLFKKSFSNYRELLTESFNGLDPSWIVFSYEEPDTWFKESKSIENIIQSIIGLGVFCFENSSLGKNRLLILHLSLKQDDLELYSEIVRDTFDFIDKNLYYSEIRFGLHHYKENDQMVIWEGLKSLYMSFGFKWKTLTNDHEGNRVIIYGKPRAKDVVFHNPRKIKIDSMAVMIKAYTILGLNENKSNEVHPTPSRENKHYQYKGGILSGVLQVLKKYSSPITNDSNNAEEETPKIDYNEVLTNCISERNQNGNEFIRTFLNQLKTSAENDILDFPASKSSFTENLSDVFTDIYSLGLEFNETQVQNSQRYLSSLMSVELNCANFSYTYLDNHSYLRLNDTNINYGKSVQENVEYRILIIPTDDYNINLFIITKDKQYGSIREDFSEGNMDLFSFSKSLFEKMEMDDIYNEVWVPSFSVESRKSSLHSLLNLQITDPNSKDFFISSGMEGVMTEIYAPKPNEAALKIEPTPNSFIIKNDFIIGMLHEKIDEIFDMPLFTIYISINNFSKI